MFLIVTLLFINLFITDVPHNNSVPYKSLYQRCSNNNSVPY